MEGEFGSAIIPGSARRLCAESVVEGSGGLGCPERHRRSRCSSARSSPQSVVPDEARLEHVTARFSRLSPPNAAVT
ncbi:hypothetical protein U1Q18_005233 [Sarracenia purpurea var. burkii]